MGRYDRALLDLQPPTPRQIPIEPDDDLTLAVWRVEQVDVGLPLQFSIGWQSVARRANVLDPFQVAQAAGRIAVTVPPVTPQLILDGSATGLVLAAWGSVLEVVYESMDGATVVLSSAFHQVQTEPLTIEAPFGTVTVTPPDPLSTAPAFSITRTNPATTRVRARVTLVPTEVRVLQIPGIGPVPAGRRLTIGTLLVDRS